MFSGDGALGLKKLADAGLAFKDVKKDGNCVFRALSDQTSGDQNLKHQEYRLGVAKHIAEGYGDAEAVLGDRVADYAWNVAQDGEWGGELEIAAWADRYRVDVAVHIPSSQGYDGKASCVYRNELGSMTCAMIAFHPDHPAGPHYTSIWPAGSYNNSTLYHLSELQELAWVSGELGVSNPRQQGHPQSMALDAHCPTKKSGEGDWVDLVVKNTFICERVSCDGSAQRRCSSTPVLQTCSVQYPIADARGEASRAADGSWCVQLPESHIEVHASNRPQSEPTPLANRIGAIAVLTNDVDVCLVEVLDEHRCRSRKQKYHRRQGEHAKPDLAVDSCPTPPKAPCADVSPPVTNPPTQNPRDSALNVQGAVAGRMRQQRAEYTWGHGVRPRLWAGLALGVLWWGLRECNVDFSVDASAETPIGAKGSSAKQLEHVDIVNEVMDAWGKYIEPRDEFDSKEEYKSSFMPTIAKLSKRPWQQRGGRSRGVPRRQQGRREPDSGEKDAAAQGAERLMCIAAWCCQISMVAVALMPPGFRKSWQQSWAGPAGKKWLAFLLVLGAVAKPCAASLPRAE
jgi:hypothetical protein